MRGEGEVDASYGEVKNKWGIVRELDCIPMPTRQANRCFRQRGKQTATFHMIEVNVNYILYVEIN